MHAAPLQINYMDACSCRKKIDIEKQQDRKSRGAGGGVYLAGLGLDDAAVLGSQRQHQVVQVGDLGGPQPRWRALPCSHHVPSHLHP